MKERYFIAELILTFAILYLAICQFAALAFYRLYLFAGLSCGCLFSYFSRKKHFNLAGLINIGIILLAVWTFYSLLRSSLSHREIILILIKGLVIFEILLSFNAHLNLYLNYIQALSIPLFMSQIVFMKGYDEIYALVSLAYLVCWLSLLRLKFYRLFWSPEAEINPSRQHYSIFLSIAVFIASIFLSGLLFSKFPLKEIAKIGFLQEFSKGMEMEPENIGQEYYDLLDKLQVEMTRLISSLSSREERARTFFA